MKKEIKINSDKNALDRAETFLNDFKSEFLSGIEDKFMNILIAYTEAVNNALNHGNINNPEKSISIKIELKDENKLKIYIKDQGEGFVKDSIPDPTLPENLLKESGRGVFLINKLAHDVQYKNTGNGTLVEMEFSL